MDMNKKLLVVAYRFPPMGGVGSRRWVKFSKYLARIGWEVHVVTTDYPWVDPINWAEDIEGVAGITVSRLPSPYPNIFMRPCQTSWGRTIVRIAKKAYDILTGLNSGLDYAERWAVPLVAYVVKYLQLNEINNLVVSGPPSSLHLCGALIKAEVPNVQLIQDYRDPWSNVHDYGINKLKSSIKKLNIMHAESLSLQAADRVVVVTSQMANDLRKTFNLQHDKVSVIYNGFDREDFPLSDRCGSIPSESGIIRVGYLGAVGRNPMGRMLALEMIAAALQRLKAPGVRWEFVFYSDLPCNYFALSRNRIMRESFRCMPMLPKQEMVEVMAGFDYCLAINGPEDSHAIASKIYDYMGACRPIILVSPHGEAAQLMESTGQYFSEYNAEKILAIFKDIVKRAHGSGVTVSGSATRYEAFNIRLLADKYAQLLR